jgi:hypothetical protein
MRMRQTLAQLERTFVEETAQDRDRSERLRREAIQRSRQRHLAKTHKRGSMRFGVLYLILLATAALVAFAMFETLYLVMG